MALFTLSDLHLALSIDKPMDIFGSSWHDYMDKIQSNWRDTVSDDDLVIIGGDVSWATYLDELDADFSFLNALPGQKLILKGNHDYWWESITKMRNYASNKKFNTLNFLHNDAFLFGDFLIAGTRLWNLPGTDGFNLEDKKIYERELIRLRISLESAKKLEEKSDGKSFLKIAVFHYPPVYFPEAKPDENVIEILNEFDVKLCIYGHLHGLKAMSALDCEERGIRFMCASADRLHFVPCKIDLL